ncbi:long-chain-fatty-acid-ligase [Plasmopara halstedii]|uniref:Long-chain-fatty-acid-ligase n=1 Tax=Plasmopara halstedii TaxID=4781 RepID=A0A0P1AZ88_PLAHL|nr:long-chain-fatty-acid-ligase [Plasmopara halstedii]CEG46863.1 long-chain-fatty-acid-ligase [Plasmopara halstedii]|eukprot:XP_024583232.1 long-chain-fatty-acid-ligase [Plasmopara halstedii]
MGYVDNHGNSPCVPLSICLAYSKQFKENNVLIFDSRASQIVKRSGFVRLRPCFLMTLEGAAGTTSDRTSGSTSVQVPTNHARENHYHLRTKSTLSDPKVISNASDTTAAVDDSRRVTSDMISFKATVVPSSNDVWTSKPRNVSSPKRRYWRLVHRKKVNDQEDNEKLTLLRQSHPFHEMKIESTVESMNSDLSKNGYMYSRGSVESDLSLLDTKDRQSYSTRRGSRVRAWKALSVTHEADGDATAIATLVNTTPMTVWSTFLQTVHSFANNVAVSGRENGSALTNGTYTWLQHAERVRCVIRALVQLGFCAGEGVVVCASTSPLVQTINLAVIALGGVIAHVRSSWSTCELQDYILPIAKATIVVVDVLNDSFREIVETLDKQSQALHFNLRAVIILGDATAVDVAAANVQTNLNVLKAQDLLAYSSLTTDEAALTPSIESLMTSVRPSQCCLLAFDYDALGRIRAAELSHDNVLFTAAALVRSFGLNHRDRLVGYLPLYHVASQVLELYVPLIAGLSVVCAPTYNQPLVCAVMEHKPTVFFATPATWARFSQQVYRAKSGVNAAIYRWAKIRATKHSQKLLFARSRGSRHRSLGYMLAKALVLNNIKKKIGLESCTACYSMLAPLDFELERLFKTVDTPIYQLFGTAENCGFAAINFPHSWEFGTSGRALPGTTIRCDERSQETVLRGRNVFLGYRNPRSSSELLSHKDNDVYTFRTISDGWLRMRQRAFLTPTGFLRLNDPNDFLVLSTGDWVPIHPFEFAMLELMPELERAVLIGDGRTFLSALFFLKTCGGASRSGTGYNKQGGGRQLDDDALRVGYTIGSTAITVSEAIRCQQWAVHFDAVLEELPLVCNVSGYRVRKWILMAADFSVESGELDPDTGDVCRRAVDRKYHALFESLYS